MVEVYRRTASPAWLSAALLLTFGVSGFVSPFAGAVGDRFDRRVVMIWSDLAGAASFAAMALAHAPGVLLALAFLAAVLETPFRAASTAAVPNLVADEEDLGWANGLLSVGANAGILIGPAIGGIMVALIGAQAVFAANAVSFVISAALVRGIRGRFMHDPIVTAAGEDGSPSEHQGIAAGMTLLFRDPVLRLIATAWVAVVLGGGLCMVADVPLAAVFHTGSWGYGLMIGSWGGGSVLGAMAGRWVNERNEPSALVFGAVLTAVFTVATGVSPWFPPVLVSIGMAGVGDALMVVAYQGAMQRRTPDVVRSRVSAAVDGAVAVAFSLSFAAAGAIVAAVGPRPAYVLGGATALLAAALLLPIRHGSARGA
jgi:MFS family permease